MTTAPIIAAMRKAAEAYGEVEKFDQRAEKWTWCIVRRDESASVTQIVATFDNPASRHHALADIRMRAALEAIGYQETIDALRSCIGIIGHSDPDDSLHETLVRIADRAEGKTP